MQEDPYDDRIRRALKGQCAPVIDGSPAILWQCPRCQRTWLSHGNHPQLHLSQQDIQAWATRLQAHPEDLPRGTCRACLVQHVGGEFSVDEYAEQGTIYGYGFTWEAMQPAQHFIVGVYRFDGMITGEPFQPRSSIITDAGRARGVLSWLATCAGQSILYQPLPEFALAYFRERETPGSHAPGTEGWTWHGAWWQTHCPPLGGLATVSFAQAGPPAQPFRLTPALTTWKRIALHFLQVMVLEDEEEA